MSYLADRPRSLLNNDDSPPGLCCCVETEVRYQSGGDSCTGEGIPSLRPLERGYRCFQPAATIYSFCYCVFFCCQAQTPITRKYGRRIYFGLQFEGAIHHEQGGTAALGL